MQVSVTGRHMEITDAIRSYVHGKVETDLADFPRVVSVHVILDIEKYRHLAEIVIQAAHHISVDARDVSDDMYVSIDRAMEKAARQMRRLHDKVVQDHKTREKLGEVDLDVQKAEGASAEG